MRSSLLTLRRRIGSMALVTMVLTCSPMLPTHAASSQALDVIGKWRLIKALDSADISALDDPEAQRLVGRIFTISRKTVKVGSPDDCLPPTFEAKSVEPGWYIREWAHGSAKNLGLPNPVTVVDLGCTSVFVKTPRHIVVFWKGWFFDAKRVR
jgi:hypothetical protein